MAEPSKILTVSYGTFSCTLEGFDNAFDTMKAIAEYFRDLAADDRYFGAEPPTPDPEMLARIAEREVERRVEARLERGAYVLRPAALTTAAGAAAAGVSGLAPWPRPDTPRTEEPAAADDRDPDVATQTSPTPERPEDLAGTTAESADGPRTEPGTPEEMTATDIADGEASAMDSPQDSVLNTASSTVPSEVDETGVTPPSIAAEAVDEQASMDGGSSDPAQDDTTVEAEAETETTPAVETASGEEADPVETKSWEDLTAEERREFRRRRRAERARRAAALASSEEAEAGPTRDAGRGDAVTAEAAPDAATFDQQDDPQAETGPETAANGATGTDKNDVEDDSVVAKLARIRALVGTGAAGAVGGAVLAAGDDAEDDPVPGADKAGDQDLHSLRSMMRQTEDNAGPDAPSAKTVAPPEADSAGRESETAPQTSGDAAATPIRARVVKMRRSDFEARYGEAAASVDRSAPNPVAKTDNTDSAPLDDTAGPREVARMDGLQQESGDAAAAEADTDLETEDDLADLARLDGLEEYDAPAPEAQSLSSSLSPDAEAELMEELAEVQRMALEEEEAERDTEETPSAPTGMSRVPADPEGGTRTEGHHRESRATLLATPPEADEAAMSRILTETDAQLNEPEASRRREAIAHLKAAVAATEAARQLGEAGKDTDEDGENMFRDDLDQVVRPRRTPRPLTRSDRPRPAPLKLVASQRVDAPAAAPESRPVLPRRVETGPAVPDAAEAAAQERFARFASDMGTAGLSDMIEAAAAHAMFNEGEEDVSRPQLMRMVQAIVPGDFSREDGLRAFGTLLRQGRLEKVRNGRFRVSPQTRFNPRRAASGS